MKAATQIVIVLDPSGSMEVVREATIESFDRFMIKQKALLLEVNVFFVQFNTGYQVLFDQPIADAPTLTYLTYQPNGATALYDAVGQTIDSIGQRLDAMPEPQRPSGVICVVLTDGLENSSRRYWRRMIAERIEHQGTSMAGISSSSAPTRTASSPLATSTFRSLRPCRFAPLRHRFVPPSMQLRHLLAQGARISGRSSPT